MNLEQEIRKTWDLWESGVPVYVRNGQLEVDPPDMVSPEATQAQLEQQQLGQKATGVDAPKIDINAGPFNSTNAGLMLDGLWQGVKDIAGAVDKTVRATPGALTEGGLSSVGGTASDDVHLYGAQRLNPVAAGKAQLAPQSIQALWREMTDGQDAQSGALSQALNLINSEGQQYGMLQPGQRFAVRRGESGYLEPIIADDSMTDSALVAGGRLVTSYYATDPLGGLGGAAAAGAKMLNEVDPNAIGAGLGAGAKGARATVKADKAIIDAAFATKVDRYNATQEVQRVRAQYPVEEGWAPLELVGMEMKDGKPIPKWRQPAYQFHVPPQGMSNEQWAGELTSKITDDVRAVVQRAGQGDQQAQYILSQASWYRDMRNRLRQEFGGMADLFADLLGTTSAQTNVRTNWDNAVEIMRRFSRGEYDKEIANYERAMAAGEDPNKVLAGITRGYQAQGMEKDAAQAAALGDYPMLTKASGALFGTNSPTSTGALIDTFRQIKAGASPKTPNFTGNLIGYTNEATVDVWAARYLSDLAGNPRIPPVAEKAVGGKHLVGSTIEQPKVGGEFGFGQKVFRQAADDINAAGVLPNGEKLGPDDLQAVAWFIEKEKWTQAGWTNKAGEGGSLDFEAARAGTRDPAGLNEARKVLNASGPTDAERAAAKADYDRLRETDPEAAQKLKKIFASKTPTDAERAAAQATFDELAAPVDRTVLGISGERPGAPMSNYGQAELAAEIDDVLRGDSSVVMYKANSTYGRFMKQDERALDVELVTRKGFDPSGLERRVVELGKQYDQDAVFVSKVLRSPEESPNARPGVEIYFTNKQSADAVRKITDMLSERGIDGFTFVTDARQADRVNVQARAGGPDTAGLTGIRFQYIPEFDEGYNAAQRAKIMQDRGELFDEITNELLLRGDVSSAQVVWYDTKVTFRDQYDGILGAAASPRSGSREVRAGRADNPPAAGADRQGRAGPVGPGTLPDGQRGSAKGR